MTAAVETLSGAMLSDRENEEAELDRAVHELKDRAPAFAKMPIAEKVRLLRACARGVVEEAEAWVKSGHRAKGLPEDAGEEWLTGPIPTLRNLRLLIDTLERLDRGKSAIPPTRVATRPDGRVEAKVFPTDGIDAALFTGIDIRQLMMPGSSVKQVIEEAGRVYHQGAEGGVSLILGAGNVSSIPPMDALYKSFAEGMVSVVKMNPVNEWAGPHLERAFAPLVEAGLLRVVYGGAEAGKHLVEHEGIDDVHITGSNHTHDVIVWGPPGAERDRRKRENDPVLKKRITSELGNVSPVAIVPADYSESELRFVAWNVAAMVTNNASFNCNAAKMLVLSKQWRQREAFLRELGSALAEVPTRIAYYPGAMNRYERLTEGRERVEKIGSETPTKLPWTIVHDLDPANAEDPAFSTEPFCGLISVTALDAPEPAEFVKKATAFMNDTLWGTLNAMFVVPPKLEKSGEVGGEIERAIVELRYGTVAINHWPALVYATTAPAWGGHPSATLDDIQSGLGWVHNTYLLEGIEKSVLRGPLTLFPKPLWFPNNRVQGKMGRKLLDMEASPSWLKVPGLALTALRG